MAEEEEGESSQTNTLTIAKAVHRVQIHLLENGPCSESQLFAAGALISRSDYEDVVIERSIANLCGNPRCSKCLAADRTRKGRFRVSLREHRVYDLEESYKFCSEECFIDSRAFSGNLSLERCSDAGLKQVGEILRFFDGGIGLKDRNGLVDHGIAVNSLADDGSFGFSRLSIKERSGAVAESVPVGAFNAVEGYVPQRDRIKDESKVKVGQNVAIRESDFTSAIILSDQKSTSLPSSSSSAERVDKMKEIPLKPCLKTSKSKVEDRGRVKWADKEEVKNSDEISRRLDSAEACAAGLVELASSLSSGEQEQLDEAVSGAGIVLLPRSNDAEVEGDSFEIDQGIVKWPKKTVLLETDLFEVEDSWHDTPPEGFNLTLSPFATMWNALFSWLTCSSIAFIYGEEENWEKFMSINGREYPRKAVIKDGRSPEIKRTMAACIARSLPSLATDLRLRVPVSSIEKAMGSLLETMSYMDALPPLKMKQWSVVALLFVHALSLSRLPGLATHLSGNQHLLRKVLDAAKVSVEEFEIMLDLVFPLGRAQPAL